MPDDIFYQLLTHMEALSITGEFSEGHKVFFYLSSIDFGKTSTLFISCIIGIDFSEEKELAG
jgi:hypothetical protein